MAGPGRAATLAGLLLAAGAVLACSGSPTEPSSLPSTPVAIALGSGGWTAVGDPASIPVSNNEEGHLALDIPAAGSIAYLYTPSPLSAIGGTLVVAVRVTTEGAAAIRHLPESGANCVIPTSVRPFFWSNDNGDGPYDRWWSNPRAITLVDGVASVSVPLSPPYWSSVNGRFGNADATVEYNFGKAVRHVTRVGLTFGGGCSFGHGVRVHDGRAVFAVTGYRIE